MTQTCPLCDKLQRLREFPPEQVIWQFPHSVAFLGPWQYHTGYCILVSRTHASELFHLPEGERRAFLDEMCLLARAIAECFQPRKLNYELLGNQVPHLHWHLFPRRHDDPETLKAVWLGLERAETNEAEKKRLQTGTRTRADIAAALRQSLQSLGAQHAI